MPLLLGLLACVDMPKLHFNEPPAAPTVRIDPEAAFTTDTLTLVYDVEAVDAEGDAVTYDVTWFLDGAERMGGAATVDPSFTTKGEVWEVVVVASDGEWSSEPVSARAMILNSPPVTTSSTLRPEGPGTEDALSLELSGEDADGDTVSWHVTWTVDGVPRSDLANLTSITADETGTGETWVATVRPYDGEEEGEAVELSTYIDNTAPTMDGVRISPAAPGAAADLTARAVALADVDGHDVTVDFDWYVDGVLMQSDVATDGEATLAGPFVRGQEVHVVAVPSDPWLAGEAVTSDVVAIVNTAPRLATATLSPTEGTEATVFTCTPSGEADDDGDPVSYDYAWYVDGAVVGASGSTLTGSHFAKGQSVSCEITPTDGADDGEPVSSDTADVVNTPPAVTAVTLSPTSPTISSTVALALTGATDADGDAITYTYEWTVSGAVVGATGTSVTSAYFTRGDTVTVTVTPSDGSEAGAAVTSDTVTIGNSAPRASSATVSPSSATTSSDLSVSVSGWSDADGDDEAYTYQWYRGSAAISGATTSTLDADETTRGDRYTCVVTPWDGWDAGTSLTSNQVSIINSSPTVTAEVDGDTSSLAECDAITLDATGSSDADEDTLSYTWSITSKPSASRSTSADIDATTDANPYFLLDAAGTFTFQLAANDGYTTVNDTVSVSVAERADNTAPVADAGADQEASGSGSCNAVGSNYVCSSCDGTFTLDGSGSVDDDGDPLTYVWTTTSSYASLSSSAAESPTVTLSNLRATYDTTTTYEVSLRLRVYDCAGGMGEDTVTVSFDCTGY